MEFVGKSLKKEFKGLGVLSGIVKSYDCSSGVFEIVYEGGETEELEFSEVSLYLEGGVEVVQEKRRVGRKPKMRRRVAEKVGSQADSGVNMKGGVDENVEEGCGLVENSKETESVEGNCNVKFDLNAGINLDYGCDSDGNVEDKMKRSKSFDLNVDMNCDLDEGLKGETQKREPKFDLNLGADDEITDACDGCDVLSNNDNNCKMLEGTPKEGFNEANQVNEHVFGDACIASAEGLQKADSVSGEDLKTNASLGVLDNNCVRNHGSSEVQLKVGPSETVNNTVIHGFQDDSGSTCVQPSRRKRRKLQATETVLRRSTRSGSAKNHVSSDTTSCVLNDPSPSPSMSAMTEEQPLVSGWVGSEEPDILPPKLQLPPPSKNLNLDGIPVLDFFSIYSCLRSFSTLLFLSPFELEDFVAALQCRIPTSLFDCIHLSILQTLRKHLEYLSTEGSESASNCLSNLNWDLLDMITWPVFMVEYLLNHSSGLKCGYDLHRLNPFKVDYYKQSSLVKVEILRCLCDDMVEVESIRSELSRRSSAAEPDIDFDRSANFEIFRKRKKTIKASGCSYLSEDAGDETADRNSDECCLCKMDGILICCDGCPAAYHSKCVGVANDLLPEGDWYCPECEIERLVLWMKPRKSLRGAELLGNDPHGRQFFSSCGYLLVSCNNSESSFNYYQRNDLPGVIKVLKSSQNFYGGILTAIHKHWDIPFSLNGANNNLDSLNHILCSEILMTRQTLSAHMPASTLASSETHAVKNEADNERRLEEYSVTGSCCNVGVEMSKSGNLVNSVTVRETPYIGSEGSAETVQISAAFQNLEKCAPKSEILLKCPPVGDSSLTSTSLDVRLENNVESSGPGFTFSVVNSKTGFKTQLQCGISYVNSYSFAQTASSVAAELVRKSTEKTNDCTKSEEEIISAQMKAISKKATKFTWSSIKYLNECVQREKCGWCFCCKVPTGDRDCLFSMNLGPVQEILKNGVVGLHSKENRNGHLVEVICHILSIEDRLRGLLLGPWLNPHHTELFRNSVLQASDVSYVKNVVLMLESNLHRLALSAEWLKHVDTVTTMGSASHVVTSSSRTSSKHGVGRRKSRFSDFDCNPSSKAVNGLGLFWWRGGRLSRQLFNWKVLPRFLASKAARQGGCTKIPGVQYPESSEFARRSKYVAWRAAVESSRSVEQLAFQIKEFDLSIRWDDIENKPHLSMLDKESKKSIRLFKKVIIRRKCIEGEVVKYLLDFGRRKVIPDIVVKRGSMLEDSSSERKKYWLEESLVPLHLVKSFEEKRLARKGNQMKPAKFLEFCRVTNHSKEKGFSYLFSKAERCEYYQCGHCKKDVPIREAVSCQYCNGFFHRRHVTKPAGASLAECTYTCHRCQDGRHLEIETRKGKSSTKEGKIQSQKCKKAATNSRSLRSKTGKKKVTGGRSQNNKSIPPSVPLRRSARNLKYVPLQNKKARGRKKGKGKGKQTKPKKGTSKKTTLVILRKARTHVLHSYWLNGLHLSRKPSDERVILFQSGKVLASSENISSNLDRPRCHLCCEAKHTSTLVYVACEICGDWFHGDAFGLTLENRCNIFGFRCHGCRKRIPPVCPHFLVSNSDASPVAKAQNNVEVENFWQVSDVVPPLSEVHSKLESHLDGDLDECEHKDLIQSVPLDTALEAEHLRLSKKQKTDTNQNLDDKDLKQDMPSVPNEIGNPLVEENTIISGI